MMKKILILAVSALILSACSGGEDRVSAPKSSSVSSSKPAEQGVLTPEDVVKQYRKAINQDDVTLAKSFIDEGVTIGVLNSDGTDSKDISTYVYTKEQMDAVIDDYSKTQQEYVKDEYIENGDYYVIVEGYEPNYITSMVWKMGREDYKIRTKYVVKNDYITEIYIMPNEDFNEDKAKEMEGVVGLECEIKDGEIYVKKAEEGLPAYRAGFIPDDKIISIDNMLVEDMRLDIDEHLYRLRGQVDTTVDVVVERDGKEHEYVLKRVAE